MTLRDISDPRVFLEGCERAKKDFRIRDDKLVFRINGSNRSNMLKLEDPKPYRLNTNYVAWLLGIAVMTTVVLFYLNLNMEDEKITVVVFEPRETLIDPHFEDLIDKDLKKIVNDFGQWGQPAFLDEIKAGEEGVSEMTKRYAINVNVSDRIPYNRELPDPRPYSCRDLKHHHDSLPKASIILVTRNEPWSLIVRTLHSVVERSPTDLIKEVIVVDDGSSYPGMSYDLMAKLEYYVTRKLPKYVHMVRMGKKSGIVPSRLRGAKIATGDVLVFLDAHCEVNDQWLEPLLDRIKHNPKAVVQPVVDIVDWDTFEYSPFTSNHYVFNGVFTWAGGFEWLEMSIPDIVSRKSDAAPHKNPIMAGGLFAIKRDYFWETGAYDDEMYGWGFENIEMSIRIWTCGGTMEIVPCSRVGHVFHSHKPEYADEGTNRSRHASTSYNMLRTVKVWYDEYERLAFQYRPHLLKINPGDITARQELRKNLKCKPFEWFIAEVVPKFVMDRDAKYSGRLMSDTGFCLTHATTFEAADSMPVLLPCDKALTGRQYFALSKNDSELRREFLCAQPHMDTSTNRFGLRLRVCDILRKTKWTYNTTTRTLVHDRVKECLDSVNGKFPILTPCHPKKPSQKWTFKDNSTLNVF